MADVALVLHDGAVAATLVPLGEVQVPRGVAVGLEASLGCC